MARGFEALAFHANGSGGKSLERFAAQGVVSALLDVTTTELADELFGGLFPAGSDRLANGVQRGLPQVIAPGGLDYIGFGPKATVPERFAGRKVLAHNDLITLVRTTPAENAEMGRVMAERLAGVTAPTTLLIPKRGVSTLDREGGPFHDPEAMAAFTEAFRAAVDDRIGVVELDHHLNDPAFAEALVAQLLENRKRAGSDATRL